MYLHLGELSGTFPASLVEDGLGQKEWNTPWHFAARVGLKFLKARRFARLAVRGL